MHSILTPYMYLYSMLNLQQFVTIIFQTVYLLLLCSDVTMKRLLENMFCADIPSDVVLVSGVNVLLTAIERRLVFVHIHTYRLLILCVYINAHVRVWLFQRVHVYVHCTICANLHAWTLTSHSCVLYIQYCICQYTYVHIPKIVLFSFTKNYMVTVHKTGPCSNLCGTIHRFML